MSKSTKSDPMDAVLRGDVKSHEKWVLSELRKQYPNAKSIDDIPPADKVQFITSLIGKTASDAFGVK